MWLRLDERLQLGDELGVPAEREIGLDPLLDDDGPQFLEPRDLRLRERLVDEVGEGWPTPERERLAERGLRGLGVVSLQRAPALLGEAREAMDVDVIRGELEHVPRRTGRDHGPERLAELRDVDLDGVRSRVGRVAGPERVDEAVGGDDAPEVEREHAEERSRLGAPETGGNAIALRLDRAEEAQRDRLRACRASSVHLCSSPGVPRILSPSSPDRHPSL